MFFASDNSGPAHPSVLAALTAANKGYAFGYGNDPITADVTARIRDLFEAPQAEVFLVSTGTAANAILLGTLANPWDAIFCADLSHIELDECNAPEFYSGAKLTLVPTIHGKMSPADLSSMMAPDRNFQNAQRGPLSLSQVTETGTIYTTDEIAALTAIARSHGCASHLDGARFANAMVALGCTPAEMSWKAGIDAVSFGGTKNGLLGAEACIIFDPELAQEFGFRRKRGGHLASKHRYLAAQMQAYLTDDLWRDLASNANDRCAQLAAGLRGAGLEMLYEPQANMIFAKIPNKTHQQLQAAGAIYYVEDGDVTDPDAVLTIRLVTDWSVTPDTVQQFIDLL